MVVTLALVISLICMHAALRLWEYISGKSLMPMLQMGPIKKATESLCSTVYRESVT